jgi:hypothetical protein
LSDSFERTAPQSVTPPKYLDGPVDYERAYELASATGLSKPSRDPAFFSDPKHMDDTPRIIRDFLDRDALIGKAMVTVRL